MTQRRLSVQEKEECYSLYSSGKHTFKSLGDNYGVSATAIKGLMNRRGLRSPPQSELQRKYHFNERWLDVIGEQQAYFIGLMYADGYNNTDRNTAVLSLKESDKHILNDISNLFSLKRPLQFVRLSPPNSNQYRLNLQSKIVTDRLDTLGCHKAKTYTLEFPDWLNKEMAPHFIRGYIDGDGWIGVTRFSLVGTEKFCGAISAIAKDMFDINTYTSTRHKERANNIREVEFSGLNKCIKFLSWIYKDASIYLDRKHDRYLAMINRKRLQDTPRICSITNCTKKHVGRGYCKNHFYEFCGGAEKRRARYITSLN